MALLLAFFFLLVFISSACGNSFHESKARDLAKSIKESALTSDDCPCNISTVYLDIYFIYDASQVTGEENLNKMWNFTVSVLNDMTLSNSEGYDNNAFKFYTRVGVVTYGNKAEWIYLLTVNNTNIKNIHSLPYNGDTRTNLADALKIAWNLQRWNVISRVPRVVFVVMAMNYNPTGVVDPLPLALEYRKKGYHQVTIMSYSFGGASVPMLADVANPGYYFQRGFNGTIDDMHQAMCDANCFCPMEYEPYKEVSPRKLPSGGCYSANTTIETQRQAINQCATADYSTNYTGYMALDQDGNKTAFLTDLFRHQPGTSFWIGLTFDTLSKRWQWPDGSPLLEEDYQPWAVGSTHDGSGGLTGVFLTANQKWQAADPRNSYSVICQTSPCSSSMYCCGAYCGPNYCACGH